MAMVNGSNGKTLDLIVKLASFLTIPSFLAIIWVVTEISDMKGVDRQQTESIGSLHQGIRERVEAWRELYDIVNELKTDVESHDAGDQAVQAHILSRLTAVEADVRQLLDGQRTSDRESRDFRGLPRTNN